MDGSLNIFPTYIDTDFGVKLFFIKQIGIKFKSIEEIKNGIRITYEYTSYTKDT